MHPIPITITARRAAAALLGAGVVALAATGCSTAGTPAPADAPAPTSAPGQHKGIVGTITAENAGTWTVVTAKGKQFTVTVTPQTRYGTAKAPGTQQQFTVGTTVRVTGTPAGSSVTATRVAAPARPAG